MAGVARVCEGCGRPFPAAKPARGPRRRYHSETCRKLASRRRRHAEAAAVTADAALAAGHARLAEALAALPASSLARVQAVLRGTTERNLSHAQGDELCSDRATARRALRATYTHEED
jgi:hypothetical protein